MSYSRRTNRRARVLSMHLASGPQDEEEDVEVIYAAKEEQGQLPSIPPVVKATKQFSTDPVAFLKVNPP